MSQLVLVRGRSSTALAELGVLVLHVGAGPFLLGGLLAYGLALLFPEISQDLRDVAPALILMSLICGLVVLLISSVLSPVREKQEVARGYTSLRFAHKDVQEVLPGTSLVIRSAGVDYLTDEEFHERLEQARQIGLTSDTRFGGGSFGRASMAFVAIVGAVVLPWILLGRVNLLVSCVALVGLAVLTVVVAIVAARRARRRQVQKASSSRGDHREETGSGQQRPKP